MKPLFLLLTTLLCAATLNAQTWNCGASTNVGGTASVKATLSNDTLYVSGTGAMASHCSSILWYSNPITTVIIDSGVTSIGQAAFSGCRSLTSVTLSNSVTSIGYDAFRSCSSLTSVTIPNSVTSIESNAFRDCSNLTSVSISYGVTSIGVYVFSGCRSLTSVIIPNSVAYIGESAFSGCRSLTSVTLSNSVTSIGSSAFNSCDSLTSVTIPNSVTSIWNNAFRGCSSLASVTIGNSVVSIRESAFSDCRSLTSVIIPKSVAYIGESAFRGCIGLRSLTIMDGTATLMLDGMGTTSTSSSYAFDGCGVDTVYMGRNISTSYTSALFGTNVKLLIVGDSVTSIGYHAFDGCNSLTSVTIPSSVSSIGNYAFSRCIGLKKLTIADGTDTLTLSASAFSNVDTVYMGRNIKTSYTATYFGSTVKQLIIGNSVTSIGSFAFNNCDSLTFVTIPSSVTSIGYNAFNSCTGLKKLTIADGTDTLTLAGSAFSNNNVDSVYMGRTIHALYNGTLFGSDVKFLAISNNVTSIGNSAFNDCDSLTTVTIPNSVTSIGAGAFSGCSSLASVTIPNSVTSIGAGAFNDCDRLASITIPNSVTSIGAGAFNSCMGLNKFIIADGTDTLMLAGVFLNTYIDTVYMGRTTVLAPYNSSLFGSDVRVLTIGNSVTSIGNLAFNGCDHLTSVTIGSSVTIIGKSAFSGCDRLASVTIGNSVISIGESAFSGCDNLTSVTIGNSVTIIGSHAFMGCSDLTSVTIPNSVISIGESAFSSCRSLTSVTIGSSVATIGERAFCYCNNLSKFINYAITPQSINMNVFENYPGVNKTTCTLRVPEASVALYRAAEVWKDFFNIEAIIPVSSISLNKITATLAVGATETLVVSVAPSNAAIENVSWISSNPTIATVDNNGRVAGVSIGTATITATTADGGKTAACIVTVTAAPTNPNNPTTTVSTAVQAAVKLYPNPTSNTLYLEADESIIKVEVYNQAGGLVLVSLNPTNEVDISTLISGWYIVKVYTSKSVVAQKILVKR